MADASVMAVEGVPFNVIDDPQVRVQPTTDYTTEVRVYFLGCMGVGKSACINMMRGLGPRDPGAAREAQDPNGVTTSLATYEFEYPTPEGKRYLFKLIDTPGFSDTKTPDDKTIADLLDKMNKPDGSIDVLVYVMACGRVRETDRKLPAYIFDGLQSIGDSQDAMKDLASRFQVVVTNTKGDRGAGPTAEAVNRFCGSIRELFKDINPHRGNALPLDRSAVFINIAHAPGILPDPSTCPPGVFTLTTERTCQQAVIEGILATRNRAEARFAPQGRQKMLEDALAHVKKALGDDWQDRLDVEKLKAAPEGIYEMISLFKRVLSTGKHEPLPDHMPLTELFKKAWNDPKINVTAKDKVAVAMAGNILPVLQNLEWNLRSPFHRWAGALSSAFRSGAHGVLYGAAALRGFLK